MKKQHSDRNILAGICFCIILAFTAMAFQDSTKIDTSASRTKVDTVPKINNIDIQIDLKDLDQTIKKSLDIAEKSVKDIDWNKISKQIEQSLKQIDMAKIQMEIDNSLKTINWEKMRSEIDKSIKEIDINKLKLDIDKGIKDAIRNINSDEMKKNIEEIKKINFDELKKEMELNKGHFSTEMQKAKLEILKAKSGLMEIKEMTTEMEKDGLINKKESNSIEYKNKELLINGKKQPQEVIEKYRKYFKEDNFKFKDED